jgi:hypothetical protein
MEMEIRIRGTESQINRLLAENKFFEALVKSAKISTDTNGDNPQMLNALWDMAWETIHLAHIIFARGTENSKGRYMAKDELLSYELNSKGDKIGEHSLSARVGGAKKVTIRYGVPAIMKINELSSGEKLYYVTNEAIPVLEQFFEQYDEDYRRDYFEKKSYFYPGEEE